MVGQLKEDVAEWYQGLSAHMRIEAMCTLIDLSLPFEIRFLGSLIEHLGRKDFGSLREAESRANSFTNGNPDDKRKLLQSLGEIAPPLSMGNGTQYGNPLIHPNNFNDSPANRPSPTHLTDSKGHPQNHSEIFQASDNNQGEHGLCNDTNIHDSVGPKKGVNSVPNHIGFSSEEETESMCIVNDVKRRKLILYISVLSPTNHDGANLYYTLLSDIEESPSPQLTWLEELDKDAQEEVSLLYTLASRHPAFTFEQRMFLGAVASKVNEMVNLKYPPRTNTNLQHPTLHAHSPGAHPVYYSHTAIPQGMDPKFSGYYIFAPPPPLHIQQSPHQPTSTPNNGEQIRNTPVAAPFQAYPSFAPYFVPHPHHAATISHPTALNPSFTQNIIASSLPIPTSASLVGGHNLSQGTPLIPPCSNSNSASVVSANNTSHQLSSPSSKVQQIHTTTTVSNSVGHQNCVSAPSLRTSSVPFQSEQNSVDVDSEESSENCDWNSPESSPFESPPQSLTPSRSQSPPSGGLPTSTSVQTVSLSSHGPSTCLVTSSGNSDMYGGPPNNSNNSSSCSSTIVKTEIQTSSGLVITTATSTSSTSCSTSASTSNNGSGMGNNGHLIGNVPSIANLNVSSSANGSNLIPTKTPSSTATASLHHTQLPSQQGHHLSQSSSIRGPSKISPSVPNSNNTQSFVNHPQSATVVSSSMISVTQQPPQIQSMMIPTVPVHMQQTTLTSANNVGGIVSHSMSSAVAFPQQSHGAHGSLGLNTNNHPPPSQAGYTCYPPLNSVVYGMNAAAFRGPTPGVLTRNQLQSSLLNNQLGMKGNDMQRGNHNLHGSLRQRNQVQNTPKRRSNVNSGGHATMPGGVSGVVPLPNNVSQSTSGKGDEVSESSKDNRSNEIIVSANPSNSKGSIQQQQQERTSGGNGGKPSYHHNMSNGLVNVHQSSSSGAVLPGNQLPNISPNNSTVVVSTNPPSHTSVLINSSNPGGSIMPNPPSKVGEDGILGDGGVGTGMESYPVSQLPYHLNGPQMYGHPTGPYIQLSNGYMTSSYYGNPAMGPPGPPSTEIMMNPPCVPHFSFPFTIPQSFTPPSTGNNKGVNNVKDKGNNLHGIGTAGGAADSISKNLSTNQHENHVTPASHTGGYYRTPSQPNRNNRGVILDIGGGALGNSSLSPVNVDVAVMPPLDELGETIHRPRKISCYNCGLSNHLGPDCKDGSMEEMTRHQFRVNYSGSSSVTADGKDGD